MAAEQGQNTTRITRKWRGLARIKDSEASIGNRPPVRVNPCPKGRCDPWRVLLLPFAGTSADPLMARSPDSQLPPYRK
jgi:hypothetical protein